jgi:hypothetical protein
MPLYWWLKVFHNPPYSPPSDPKHGNVPLDQSNEPIGWPRSNLSWGSFLLPWYPLGDDLCHKCIEETKVGE